MKIIKITFILIIFISTNVFCQSNKDKQEKSTSSNYIYGITIPYEKTLTVNISPNVTINPTLMDKLKNDSTQSVSEWLTILAYWITAIATVGLFWFTAKLWKATGAMVDKQELCTRRQLRAYLCVSEVIVIYMGNRGAIAKIKVSNTGQTPAKIISNKIRSEIENRSENKIFDSPEIIFGKPIVSPGAEITLEYEIKTIIDLNDFNFFKPEKVFYAWGIIEYYDIFDEIQNLEFNYMSTEGTFDGEGFTYWKLYPANNGNNCT